MRIGRPSGVIARSAGFMAQPIAQRAGSEQEATGPPIVVRELVVETGASAVVIGRFAISIRRLRTRIRGPEQRAIGFRHVLLGASASLRKPFGSIGGFRQDIARSKIVISESLIDTRRSVMSIRGPMIDLRERQASIAKRQGSIQRSPMTCNCFDQRFGESKERSWRSDQCLRESKECSWRSDQCLGDSKECSPRGAGRPSGFLSPRCR